MEGFKLSKEDADLLAWAKTQKSNGANSHCVSLSGSNLESLDFALWEGMHEGPYSAYQDMSEMWHVLDSVDDSVVQTKSKTMADYLTAIFNSSNAERRHETHD